MKKETEKNKYESINLSKIKRDRLIEKIHQMKENLDDETYAIFNEIESELNKMPYGLVWEEHSENVDDELKTKIPVFVNDKKKEIHTLDDSPYNFLLEGDNLHSLKLLEKTHKGRIDLIYIDPPYNTGKEDFVYNDKMINEENDYRHSKWLSFMNRRLTIAKNLLNENGVIFISIDDNEYAPLKLLCDDIFGQHNCLSIHHIQVRYANKSLNERKAFQECLEYVLIYAKDANKFDANRPVTDYSIDSFKFKIKETGKSKKIKVGEREVEVFTKGNWTIEKVEPSLDKLKETWVTGSIYSGTGHGLTYQKIVEPRLKIDGYGSLYKIYGLGEDGLGYRYFTNPQKEGATKGKMYTGIPLNKKEDIKKGTATKLGTITNFYDFSPDFGNIRSEGGVPFNSGKKPIKMIKQFINYHKNKNITVLDFFAGSGSTAHAVLQLNSEDGGNRRFIMCTNNENNICEEITFKRISNVINGYANHEGIKANMMYYHTDYIEKKNDGSVQEKLLKNVIELIQLEHHCKIDNKEILVAFNEDELDEIFKNDLSCCKKLFIPREVFLNTNQKTIVNKYNIQKIYIPEYYFAKELKETDEL